MRPNPPMVDPQPSRRLAPGRPFPTAQTAAIVVAAISLATFLVGCGSALPVPSLAPTGSPLESPSIDGLLVATGGILQVTQPDGGLTAFDGPAVNVVAVTAGNRHVVALDVDHQALLSADPLARQRTWRPVAIPAAATEAEPLLALSPLGLDLAVTAGDPQGRSFDLILADAASGAARSITVDRGLNGPPVWVGPAMIAVNTIGRDQRSGFSVIDLATNVVTDGPSSGFALAATGDGELIAFDEGRSGDVLVGDRAEWLAGEFDQMARIASAPGTGADQVAISADGSRLAIVRRTDARAAIEILARIHGPWHSIRTVAIDGDHALSIAWLR